MTGFLDPLDTQEDESTTLENDTTLVASIRDLVLLAHPEVVPELVRGESIADLLASVEPARQAYAELAARIQPATSKPVTPPAVPAGGTLPAPLDLDRMPAAEKLRRGLQARRQS